MPDVGQRSSADAKKIYRDFLDKPAELLKKNGVMVVYTKESAHMEELLKQNENYRLEKKYCISEKNNAYLYTY